MSDKVSEVKLKIDYEIIQHFSQHLYGSPNKAVEELVSNSFDAAAQEVRVYIPKTQTQKSVVVWDDGDSMDVAGLQNLWWIARSPKREEKREVEVRKSGATYKRKVIGKFGIGKLASYAIGDRMTHLCRRGDDFLLVRVKYTRLEKLGERARRKEAAEAASQAADSTGHGDEEAHESGGGEPGDPPTFTTPIIKLTETEARRFVESLFDGAGRTEKTNAAIDSLFKKESWTLAAITNLKEEKLSLLTYGRLNWLLGTGMPLRPDFKVWLNDEEVSSKLEKNALHCWDLGTKEVQEAIRSVWADERDDGKVRGEPVFGEEIGLDSRSPDKKIPFVQLPNLGAVFGEMRIFEDSLVSGKASELARSHGFFILVRGRLLNADDDKLFIKHPSYGAFNRSQFILNADGLDAELLADRERLNKQTPRTIELEVLSRAVYQAVRSKSEAVEEEKANRIKTESLIPVRSRDYYREPISALLAQADEKTHSGFEIDAPKVERKALGAGEQLSLFAPEAGGFQINEAHPLYKQLKSEFGDGNVAKKFYRFIEAFAIADRLLEGHLYLVGLDEETVAEIMRWRDEQLRTFAVSLGNNQSDLETKLWNASFKGDKEFEEATAAVLRDMGFECTHDGGSGKKDVLVAAPIGTDGYKLIFEAKGCSEKYKVKNDGAEVSGAANHLKGTGATHAVIIAREFTGFGQDAEADAAVLGECRMIKGDAVSIITVEALCRLHQAMGRYHYRMDLLKDVFTAIEPPAAKLRRIEELREPMEGFDYKLVLNRIWERQGNQAQKDVVAYRAIMQDMNTELGEDYDIAAFDAKLQALEELAKGHIELNTKERTVFLRNSPEHLISRIEKTLGNQTAGSQSFPPAAG